VRDEAAFTAFVVARGPALLRLAWLLTADSDAAQDLVQEALARAVGRWDRIADGAHEAYLRTTIRSVWVDGWRRRRGAWLDVVPDLPDDPAAGTRPGPGDTADDTASRLTLEDALARLTPRQRAVLVLRFYEDLGEAATAQALGCSTGTVKSQTSHALARLRVLAPELAEAFGRAPVVRTGPAVEVTR
jgi:RNA polymerase sigma-70 factor (sigma-E family)